MSTIRLGVNIDHVATLRNARGGTFPDPIQAAILALNAGAEGITAHLREDRRHIRDDDILRLKETIKGPLNLELAATDELVSFACEVRPHACCLVPERRQEITTEGGLDVATQHVTLRPIVARLTAAGIRVSLFVDPEPRQLIAASKVAAPVVELHTGAYANGGAHELARLRQAAALTTELGLECHAGHGLTYDNVSAVAAIPEIVELNIGHFLIGAALFEGLEAVTRRMKDLIETSRKR